MTTIAYDGYTLASDSQSTMGDMIYENDCQKIFPDVGGFAAIAICGDWQAAVDILEDIREQNLGIEQVRSVDAEAFGEALLVGITKETYECWAIQGTKSTRITKPVAYGSGQPYAMTALDLGQTATQAVLAASLRDLVTNDTVQEYTIPTEEEQKNEE